MSSNPSREKLLQEEIERLEAENKKLKRQVIEQAETIASLKQDFLHPVSCGY